MAGRHRAPKEPSHLARNTVSLGIAISSATAGVVTICEPLAVAATTPAALPSPVLALAGAEVSAPAPTPYTVIAGDWLSKIAPHYGETWQTLYRDNAGVVGSDPNLIFPGQVLTIRNGAMVSPGSTSTYVPRHAASFQAPLHAMNVTQSFKGAAHRGVDLAASVGTPGYAVADGTVLFSGTASGFGLWTVIRSVVDGETVDFVYGHMDHLIVSVGDHVAVGDHIIDTGTNGVVTGPHLHFEVWIGGRLTGHPVDPTTWLRAHGVNA